LRLHIGPLCSQSQGFSTDGLHLNAQSPVRKPYEKGLGSIGSIKIIGDPAGSSFTLDDLNGTPSAPVPEPVTLLLLGSGFGGIWLRRRRAAG
jgi:hypothetical protein